MLPYSILEAAGRKSVTVFLEGEPLTTDDTNPNFDTIVEMIHNGQTDGLRARFSAKNLVEDKFLNLSERVAMRGQVIYFDGDPVESVLTDHLVSVLQEGTEDATPILNFWEKIATNPSDNSRENLFRWLKSQHRESGLTIDEDGDIIGYKAVTGDLLSTRSGPGIVNDEVFEDSQLSNQPGNVVAMPRSIVTDDPSVACSVGLHVGTRGYAEAFAPRDGKIVLVKVNPRDVVSVPSDSRDQKMRVCRYEVLEILEPERKLDSFYGSGITTGVPSEVTFNEDDEEEEFECLWCYNLVDDEGEVCDDCRFSDSGY